MAGRPIFLPLYYIIFVVVSVLFCVFFLAYVPIVSSLSCNFKTYCTMFSALGAWLSYVSHGLVCLLAVTHIAVQRVKNLLRLVILF